MSSGIIMFKLVMYSYVKKYIGSQLYFTPISLSCECIRRSFKNVVHTGSAAIVPNVCHEIQNRHNGGIARLNFIIWRALNKPAGALYKGSLSLTA